MSAGGLVWVDMEVAGDEFKSGRMHLSLVDDASPRRPGADPPPKRVQVEVEVSGERQIFSVNLRDWRAVVRMSGQW